MTKGLIKVGIVFGGKSGEHEVSCQSAEAIKRNLNKNKYEAIEIFVDKKNNFDMERLKQADVIFPIVHGSFGEDGCLQGMLEMLGKPYVGAGVLGSALGMDKEVQKRLLMQAGIKVAEYIVIKNKKEIKRLRKLKYPVFVKPASLGSSVGVSKVNDESGLAPALKEALRYDTMVLVEEYIKGREIECAVLGNQMPLASLPGEVIPRGHDFYDYEAKYIDENGAELKAPADLPGSVRVEIQKLAIKVFKALECSGMARVDIFLKPDGELVVNEINTLPGFTNSSMYPKLWEVSGVTFPNLVDQLIQLARERKRIEDNLKRSYN